MALLVTVAGVLHADEFDALAKQLSKGTTSLKKKTVAVLAFPYHDDKISSGSSIVSERLTTCLVGMRKIQIVERRLIQKLLEEKKLDETGVIDQQNAQAIGSLLGVEAIVTGTLIELEGNETEVNARMISAESGEVLSAGRLQTATVWDDRPVRITRRPTRRMQKTSLEADSFLSDENDEIDYDSAPKRKGKKMKFSNESFPAGKRIYHGTAFDPGKGAKKSLESAYEVPDHYGYTPTQTWGNTAPAKTSNPPPSKPSSSFIRQQINDFKAERNIGKSSSH